MNYMFPHHFVICSSNSSNFFTNLFTYIAGLYLLKHKGGNLYDYEAKKSYLCNGEFICTFYSSAAA
jgi:hypothetical protein